MNKVFTEEPFIEWHNEIPFAIAILNSKYAHLLSNLALKYESDILELKADEMWSESISNTTSSRYKNYNIFLLDSSYLPLYLAIRQLFRFFLKEINHDVFPSYIRSWYNIRRFDQDIHRHTHEARFIGSFLAYSEGSYTSYGPLKDSNEKDHKFINKDGMLLITKSALGNFHEVPKWHNHEHPRISYAFDIIHQYQWKKDKGYIPFDGN